MKIPVVGLGGIATGEDAAEFLVAGASAVEVGTATFWDPQSPVRVARELGRVSAGRTSRERERDGRDARMAESLTAPPGHWYHKNS